MHNMKNMLCVFSVLVAIAPVLAERGKPMSWAFRSCALAAGAAALLSAQAVTAAPVAAQRASVDPLVSLSVLGTAQSRAAVCSTGSCGTSLAMASPATAMPASAAATAAAQGDPYGRRVGVLPIALGLLAVIALIVIIASSGGGNAHGDLTPVSPD